MKQTLAVLAILALFLGALAADVATKSDRPLSRQRRRLDQLGQMMSGATGQQYASYIGYGNYCGPGGEGIPVDGLDACCEKHDLCYDAASRKNSAGQCGDKTGPKFHTYLSRYNYDDLGQGNFKCTDDKTSGYSSCLYDLCVCDKVFSECLAPIKDQYKKEHLKDSHKFLRGLVRMVETAPNVADWVWKMIESLLS